MSENYPSDVKLDENPNGTVSFATEVVATIAGVASMISPSSGLADMFSRKSNRNLTKGVRIDLADNKVSADITITVEYGSPVPDVARNIQENVKKAIETMSGLDVKSVDVHVTGISFEREQRANAELDEQQRKMLEKTAESEAITEAEPAAGEDMEDESELIDEEDEESIDDQELDEDEIGEEDPEDEELEENEPWKEESIESESECDEKESDAEESDLEEDDINESPEDAEASDICEEDKELAAHAQKDMNGTVE